MPFGTERRAVGREPLTNRRGTIDHDPGQHDRDRDADEKRPPPPSSPENDRNQDRREQEDHEDREDAESAQSRPQSVGARDPWVDALFDWFRRLRDITNGTFTLEEHDVLGNDHHVVALSRREPSG